MTMGIYVPSKGRFRADQLSAGVHKSASPKLRERMVFVVPQEELTEYKARMVSVSPETKVVGCPAKGIAETRLWIGHLARAEDQESFLMLDDDIQFFNRISVDSEKLEKASPVAVNVMLNVVEMLLEEGPYAHVGISAREGNNRLGTGDIDFRAENTRTLRCLGYKTDAFLGMQHGRVDVMEDFDVNLQLLEHGLKNCNLGFYAQDQRMTNAPGGCSTYRTHAVHEASAKRLAELHPGVVTLRQKTNKTDASGFGTRTEVTIQWKKAYAQGMAKLGAKAC